MAVFITNDFPPHRGGIQRMMSRLAQEFAADDDRVQVVAPQLPDSAAFDAVQNFRVLRYPGKDRLTSFLAMTIFFFWVRLKAKDQSTIASIWFPAGLAACFVPRPMRGRFAVLAHGTEIAPERGGIRRHIMRYVFGRADVIIANSSFTRDLLVRAGITGPIRIVNPGIDADPIEPVRSSRPTILSVGRLVARKGFDTLITALPSILDTFPDARYEIVGSGPQRAELEALATRLKVRDSVVFLGSVSDEEMHEAYARAWIFALPVRTIENDVEGFGMVYLEAALAELPAIGGKNSGAEDAIVPGETGLIVDGTSSADVAAAVLGLLGDTSASKRMGTAGRDRALHHFTWKRSASELAAHIGNSR